jgi:tetratricopeptide (TPR) repeat protein
LELTFSEGVISALRETEGVRMIQTSAPISPGSSGGGLFDAHGNLVGITSFQLREGQSLNFAIPGEWVSGMLSSSTEAAAKSSARLSDVELESRAWLGIGLEAVTKENNDLAVHSFRKCAELKQSDASRAWLELGHREDGERAIAAYEKAIELKPDYAEAWRALAFKRLLRKEYDQAISAAKEATRLEPGNWKGWLFLGGSYTESGSYDLAINAFQQAEKFAPDKTKSSMLSFLGEAYAKKGDREQVLRIYQELKGSDPKIGEKFFRENVLPKPAAMAQAKKMSQRDQLLRILRNAPIDDTTRQEAWDAFNQASSSDDLVARLNKLNIPDTVKQSIYGLQFRKP